ncbi:hypothetical protein D8T40_22310 [Vibrio vulnificus]|nr:hypothetical protein D8T40_22310 [Vibrio vulnificus]
METPRVDSPFEAFVSFVAYCFAITLTPLLECDFTQKYQASTRSTPKAVKQTAKTQNNQG